MKLLGLEALNAFPELIVKAGNQHLRVLGLLRTGNCYFSSSQLVVEI